MRISAFAEFWRGSYADFSDRKTKRQKRQKELLNLRLYLIGKGEGADGCECFECVVYCGLKSYRLNMVCRKIGHRGQSSEQGCAMPMPATVNQSCSHPFIGSASTKLLS